MKMGRWQPDTVGDRPCIGDTVAKLGSEPRAPGSYTAIPSIVAGCQFVEIGEYMVASVPGHYLIGTARCLENGLTPLQGKV